MENADLSRIVGALLRRHLINGTRKCVRKKDRHGVLSLNFRRGRMMESSGWCKKCNSQLMVNKNEWLHMDACAGAGSAEYAREWAGLLVPQRVAALLQVFATFLQLRGIDKAERRETADD